MTGNQTTIRHCGEGDFEQIQKLLIDAFPTKAESELVNELRSADRIVCEMVVTDNDAIVGHIAFSPVQIEYTPGDVNNVLRGVGLAPLAVSRDHQGCGIGSKLVEFAIKDSLIGKQDFVVVLGYPGFYTRLGFQKASNFGLKNDYSVDEEFMVIELVSDCLRTINGTVKFCEEFARFE